MAMQFSKEDQEKLKNDKSEIYRKKENGNILSNTT